MRHISQRPANCHLLGGCLLGRLILRIICCVVKLLRASLCCLQASHARQLKDIKKTAETELTKELADLTPVGVEAKLRAKLEAQQQLIDMLNEDSSASAMHQVKARSSCRKVNLSFSIQQ